jgi:hypothetical protein
MTAPGGDPVQRTLTSLIVAGKPILLGLALAGASIAILGASPLPTPFLSESRAAMDKMMSAMDVKPSGHVDEDFVAMMVPHHQGAIDMAQSELRYGTNEQLRRIAQEIIVEQQQEIAAMRLALGQPLPASKSSPDQPSPSGAAGRKSTPPQPDMHTH